MDQVEITLGVDFKQYQACCEMNRLTLCWLQVRRMLQADCEMIWSRLGVDGEKQGKSIFVKDGVR